MFKKIIEDFCDNDYNSTEFIVYDIETSLINSIRRVLYTDLIFSGIKENDIDISYNTSVLNNEMIKQRLSSLPICSNKEIYISIDEHNTTDDIINIYSSHIIKPEHVKIYDDILLYKLHPGQEIHLKALITTGNVNETSINHKNTINTFFKIIKEIEIKNKSKTKQIIDLLKENYIIYTDIIQDKILIKNLKHNMTNYIYKKLNMTEDDFTIKDCYYNNLPVYLFTLETFFNNPEDTLKEAIQYLYNKFKDFNGIDLEVEQENNNIKIFFKNQDYTTLNPIMRYLNKRDEIIISTYNKEHPLENLFILYIKIKENNNYIKILKETVNYISDFYKSIKIN